MKVVGIEGGHPALHSALTGAGLPTGDLDLPGRRFFAFRDEADDLLAYGGIEPLGKEALLRSLVIAIDRRRQGLGRQVMARLCELAQGLGAERAWMLTARLVPFGLACGFEIVARAEVSAPIRETRQFLELCPDSAVVLRKNLV